MVQGLDTGATAPETESLPQVTRRGARVVAMSAYAVALTAYSELLGIPNDTVSVFVWLWFGTIAWNIEAPWRYHLRFVRDWSIPMVGLVIYFYSRGLTDELALPVHITMPIRVDEWLGVGTLPTEWLQHRLCGDPCLRESDPRWYDVFFTTVYASHFLTGLTIAAVLWVRRREEWLRWMRRYVSINFGALACYILYPMAPPWMASEDGYIHEAIPRLTGRGWAGSTWSSRALATRSPRCRHCTPASRSWWRCTGYGGSARPCVGCCRSTRWRCP
jgi:hypothetical protein